jgi:membrane fusion protein (multidrug efflux system)
MQHTFCLTGCLAAHAKAADYKNQRLGTVKVAFLKICLGPAALLLGLILALVSPCEIAAGPSGPASAAPLVTVAPVTLQEVNPPAEYVGHVEAIRAVDLRARVEGFLEQVNFKEGDYVQAGDLLYLIEQAPYEAKVAADKAGVVKAQADLTKARQYLDRVRTVRSGGVSATDIDNAVAEELRARGQLQEAQADLARSELDLGYTTIRAPMSGRIGRTAYTMGNLVGPDSGPLARIIQLDPIRVVYSVSENDLADYQKALRNSPEHADNPGLVPHIRLPDGEMYESAGRLDFVNNEVDAKTGTIAVWAVFDNHDGLLLPGQYGTVLVRRSKAEMLPVVPQSAVQEDREGRYVLVVDDANRVLERRVQTGPVFGTVWAIESGLAAKERVIVEGIQKVSPGVVVETTTAGEGEGK